MNFVVLFVIILSFFSCGIRLLRAHQEIGESCNTSSGETGVCVPQPDCLKLDSKPANSDFAETCKLSVDGTPIICCVVKTDNSNLRPGYVSPKSKPTQDEPDDSVTSMNETEARIYTTPRKKPHTKSSHKITPKTAYYNDQSTNKNYVNDYSKKTSQQSETKYYSSNDNFSEDDYSSNDRVNNFQSNYYNYETSRPGDSYTNPHSSDVVFRPSGSRPNQNTKPASNNYYTNKPKPTKPSTENYDSGEIHFPNQQSTRRPTGNPGFQNHNYGPNKGNQYYPNQNVKPVQENGDSDWGSTSNNRPTRPAHYRPTEEPIWGSTSRGSTRPSNGLINTGGWSTSSQQQQRISAIKCSEYSKNVTSTISAIPLSIDSQATVHHVSECRHDASTLIVGGSKAVLGEYPHMAALGFKSGSTIQYNCGGSLISEDYVLTAAHCVRSSLGEPKHVRLGDLNLERDDDGAQPQIINVASVTVHPDYKPPQLYNDIALIKLARRASFNRDLRPACLHYKRSIDTKKVTATGWGSTNYGEISSDDLLKVGLDIIDNDQCNQLYGDDNKLGKGIINSMLCAGELTGKKDTCQGDSGGPLQMQDPNNKCVFHIVGITSFGRSCGAANSPGIYTRVSEYVSWIEERVWPGHRRY